MSWFIIGRFSTGDQLTSHQTAGLLMDRTKSKDHLPSVNMLFAGFRIPVGLQWDKMPLNTKGVTNVFRNPLILCG